MSRSTITFRGREVGVVLYLHSHSFEVTGTIDLSDFGKSFQPLWSYIENVGIEDIPFDEDLMNDSHWGLVDGETSRDIYFPMVQEDGTVFWRWR